MDEFLAVGRVCDGVIAICHLEARTLRIASANNRSPSAISSAPYDHSFCHNTNLFILFFLNRLLLSLTLRLSDMPFRRRPGSGLQDKYWALQASKWMRARVGFMWLRYSIVERYENPNRIVLVKFRYVQLQNRWLFSVVRAVSRRHSTRVPTLRHKATQRK